MKRFHVQFQMRFIVAFNFSLIIIVYMIKKFNISDCKSVIMLGQKEYRYNFSRAQIYYLLRNLVHEANQKIQKITEFHFSLEPFTSDCANKKTSIIRNKGIYTAKIGHRVYVTTS